MHHQVRGNAGSTHHHRESRVRASTAPQQPQQKTTCLPRLIKTHTRKSPFRVASKYQVSLLRTISRHPTAVLHPLSSSSTQKRARCSSSPPPSSASHLPQPQMKLWEGTRSRGGGWGCQLPPVSFRNFHTSTWNVWRHVSEEYFWNFPSVSRNPGGGRPSLYLLLL